MMIICKLYSSVAPLFDPHFIFIFKSFINEDFKNINYAVNLGFQAHLITKMEPIGLKKVNRTHAAYVELQSQDVNSLKRKFYFNKNTINQRIANQYIVQVDFKARSYRPLHMRFILHFRDQTGMIILIEQYL